MKKQCIGLLIVAAAGAAQAQSKDFAALPACASGFEAGHDLRAATNRNQAFFLLISDA